MSCEVYSAGYNGSRLARPGSEIMARVEGIPDDIIFMASGWKFNIFYTESGHWYGNGDNSYHQLGDNEDECVSPRPLRSWDSIRPLWFACGDKFTGIITENYELYVCGHFFGDNLRKIETPEPVHFLACGTEYMIVLPKGPGVYCFNNDAEMTIAAPSITFIDAGCGSTHSIAISSEGKLYSWGRGKACGMGQKRYCCKDPKTIPQELDLKFKRVFSYNRVSYALTEDGELYSTGNNNYGQAGYPESIKKSNSLLKVEAPENIEYISVGDTQAYLLTTSGQIFSTGDGDEYRLLNNDSSRVFGFKQAELCKDMTVSFVSTGCSHVFILTGMPRVLKHPILSTKPEINSEILTVTIGSRTVQVDTSLLGLSAYGLKTGDIVLYKTVNKNATVLGTSRDGVVINIEDGNEFAAVPFMEVLSVFTLIKRKNSQLVQITSKSGNTISVETSDLALLPFGFRAGEIIENEHFGKGTVIGAQCGMLWISFLQDKEQPTCIQGMKADELSNRFKIIQPKDREISRLYIDDKYYNIETKPGIILSKYNIYKDDIVLADEISKVIGEFNGTALVEDFGSRRKHFISPNSIKLLRRFTNETTLVNSKAFDGSVISVNVGCSSSDPLIPLDRILFAGGFATVIGKSSDGYWIQTDDSIALNAGLIQFDIKQPYRLLRRIGSPYYFDNYNVSIPETVYNKDVSLPGDVINYCNERYIVLGRESTGKFGLFNLKSNSIDSISTQELSKATTIYRAEHYFLTIPTAVKVPTRVDVSILTFAGRTIKPLDVVQTPEGKAVVAGISDNNVWYLPEGDTGSICFPTQTEFSGVINVIERFGFNIQIPSKTQ